MARYLIVGGSSGIGETLIKRLLAKDHEVSILCLMDPSIPEAAHLSCDVIKGSFPEIEGVLNGLIYCPGSINLKPLS